ncbi:uncharacterized protein Tco025E_03596 [Trypanosoma conorhini]|uniref:Uncharacterized protein n=1 Tax=Trypanosoma conorhini TaxID=83891 RepID=A0A3R7L4W8_9TRYP|nr:uncharacterized protein Tco025E_03596 [Trypanosoma conorhini]RNF21153.1 hypothetical protein Tco025E_03596 [Trypanosoma conorhini]
MWGSNSAARAEGSTLSPEDARSHRAHPATRGGGEYRHSSSSGDFSHILSAAHINFSHANPEASSSTATGKMRGLPSPAVDYFTHGLNAPNVGCPSCAQFDDIRESLKSVEASYLGEIAQLRRMVEQADAERVDSVNRLEQTLLDLDRSRQLNLSRDCEIQLLSGQLRQVKDGSQRLEYELASLRQLYMSDVALYQQREVDFFLESERRARVAVALTEEGWRSAVEARCSSAVEVGRRRRCSHPSQSVGALCSPRVSNGLSSMRDRPSTSSAPPLKLSITRHVGKHGGGGGGGWGSGITPGGKGGLLTELRQSNNTLTELNNKLQRELGVKEDQIALLRQQLPLQAEGPARPRQQGVDEDSLEREMQEKIEEMYLDEIFLAQTCERHRLEAEAMEERVHLLHWLQQQLHGEPPRKQLVESAQRTPEEEEPPEPRLRRRFGYYLGGGASMYEVLCKMLEQQQRDMRVFLFEEVPGTLQGALREQLPGFKQSVESHYLGEGGLRSNLGKVAQTPRRDEHGNVLPAARTDESRGKNVVYIQGVPQQFCAANPPQASGGLAFLYDAVKKMLRSMSRNANVMCGKLNDIIVSNSAVARQLTLLTIPSAQRRAAASPSRKCSATASPSVADTRFLDASTQTSSGSKQFHFELDNFDAAPPPGNAAANAPVASPMPPSHEWDVMDSGDESIPPLPLSSTERKAPYDVDDF